MPLDIPHSPRPGSRGFQPLAAAFLLRAGLPFAEILSAERIERVFAKHDGLFGDHGIYSTALTVWSFLSQVLRDGKEEIKASSTGPRKRYLTPLLSLRWV
jgi:hypothetical protein